MKRILALLSLVCALFVVSACHYHIELSVNASAELLYDGKSPEIWGPNQFPVHHTTITESDLESLFLDLTKKADTDFKAAFLYLEIYDEIGQKPLPNKTYGVVFDSRTGRYSFAEIYD